MNFPIRSPPTHTRHGMDIVLSLSLPAQYIHHAIIRDTHVPALNNSIQRSDNEKTTIPIPLLGWLIAPHRESPRNAHTMLCPSHTREYAMENTGRGRSSNSGRPITHIQSPSIKYHRCRQPSNYQLFFLS